MSRTVTRGTHTAAHYLSAAQALEEQLGRSSGTTFRDHAGTAVACLIRFFDLVLEQIQIEQGGVLISTHEPGAPRCALSIFTDSLKAALDSEEGPGLPEIERLAISFKTFFRRVEKEQRTVGAPLEKLAVRVFLRALIKQGEMAREAARTRQQEDD